MSRGSMFLGASNKKAKTIVLQIQGLEDHVRCTVLHCTTYIRVPRYGIDAAVCSVCMYASSPDTKANSRATSSGGEGCR